MSDESETCGGLSGETASGKNKTTPSNASSVNEGSNSEYRKSLLQAVPEEAMTPPNFQIPESNASDIAPSECSSYYRKGKRKILITRTNNPLRKIEILRCSFLRESWKGYFRDF